MRGVPQRRSTTTCMASSRWAASISRSAIRLCSCCTRTWTGSYALWQTHPAHPDRLDPGLSTDPRAATRNLNGFIEPWSTGHIGGVRYRPTVRRPWYAPGEARAAPHTYKHASVVAPPCYDTLPITLTKIAPAGSSPLRFIDVPTGSTTARALRVEVRGCRPVQVTAALKRRPRLHAAPGVGRLAASARLR